MLQKVSIKTLPARLFSQEGHSREVRKFVAVVKYERRLQTGVGQERRMRQLRKRVSIAGHRLPPRSEGLRRVCHAAWRLLKGLSYEDRAAGAPKAICGNAEGSCGSAKAPDAPQPSTPNASSTPAPDPGGCSTLRVFRARLADSAARSRAWRANCRSNGQGEGRVVGGGGYRRSGDLPRRA